MSPNGSSNSNLSITSTNGDAVTDQPATVTPVEAYSVVLSAAALTLAAILGGGGSLTILLALFRSRRIRKYSYTLVLVFFFLCCGLSLLWSPMELAHLLTFHYSLDSPTADFGVATFAVYVFLVSGLALLVLALCLENVLRVLGKFSEKVRHAWPVAVCVGMFLLSLSLTLVFLCSSLGGGGEGQKGDGVSYLILRPESSSTSRLVVLALLLLLVVGGAVAVVAVAAVAVKRGGMVVEKVSESFLSTARSTSADANNTNASTTAHFLLNQVEEGAAPSDDQDKAITVSASPSFSTLPPTIVTTDVMSAKGRNSPVRLSELPAPPAPKGPSMLGVNMAQILGRRRHTICQIGDSSSSQPDPASKPKQYGYVRKFSVDVAALQAQLENPKLFKDKAPFQSDQDLTLQHKDSKTMVPLLPLRSGGRSEDTGGGHGTTTSVLPLPFPAVPRPPVITVSEDVKEEEEEEGEGEEGEAETGVGKGLNGRAEYAPVQDKAELTSVPRLPVTQPVDEDEEEEEEKEQDNADDNQGVVRPRQDDDDDEEETSGKTASDCQMTDRDADFVKMTLLMAFTFALCTFPLFIMEAVKGKVDARTYVNVSTCARALSSIQTIIYPHIVICMDSVVRAAVRRLQAEVSRLCRCFRDGDCWDSTSLPDRANSSTSQL